MKEKHRLADSLSFRILFLMIALSIFLGAGLYALVFNSVSEFEEVLIEEEFTWISRRLSNIIDDEYFNMLVSGYAGDERLVLLSKGEALLHIRDFVESRKFAAAVFSETEERTVLSVGVTDEVIWKIMGTQPENEILDLGLGGPFRYAYQFVFEPWQWHIVFTQEVTGYRALLARVRTAYVLAAGILSLAAILFYLFLNRQIEKPINEIIESLSGEKHPRYRGIREFEFLSDTIHRMMHTIDENAKWIDSLLSTVGALIIATDPQGRIVLLNRTCEEITGFKSGEVKGRYFWEVLIPPNLVEDFRSRYTRILEQKEPYSFESPLLTASGEEIIVLWNNTVIMGTNDEVGWFIAAGTDITRMTRIKEELEDSKQFLSDIFDSIQDGIAILDTEMTIISVNHTMEKWYRHHSPLVGRKCWEVFQNRTSPCEKCLSKETMKTGRTNFKVIPRVGPQGAPSGWLEMFTFPFIDTTTGGMKGTIEYMRDITDRKYAEEQLKSSLMEKDVLLKEIHHRVKNNFQIISSLMNFQAQRITDEKLTEIYRESQNRVLSMALIHQDLYQARNLTQVNFREYLRELAKNLGVSYGIKGNRVDLDIEAEQADLIVDTAIPCGLIVNELLSNALRHAFPGERRGRILVSFQVLSDDSYSLVITDDGVGFPEDLDPEKPKTIGMQLVYLLVEQLGGTIEMIRDKGTSFTITFREYQEAGSRLD